MKATFKHLIQGFTGKADGLVFYYDRRLNKIIIRRLAKVKLTERHENFGNASTNMKRLNLSAAYKEDFKVYTDLYNRLRVNFDHPVSSWYNLFLKMMYAMQKALPEQVDLRTITREQIYSEDLPCKTLCDAVLAGLLPAVRNYEKLDNPL